MHQATNKIAPSSDLARRILLVCSNACNEVEKALVNAGYAVAIAREGGRAISQARTELFDAALLVSTGRDMDLAATALNLRAVRVSMPIVIATGFVEAGETNRRREMIASLIPNTKLVDVAGFASFFSQLAREVYTR
jgi:PleD family two-component response regulator